MKVLLLAAFPLACLGQNTDVFNYRETDVDARDFGPRDWKEVECDDVDECVSIDAPATNNGLLEYVVECERSL